MEKPKTLFECWAQERNITVEEMRAIIAARIEAGMNKPNWTTVLLSSGCLRLTRKKSSGAARWTSPPIKPPSALPASFWKSITASSAAGASCPTASRADGKTYIGAADYPVCGPFHCKGGLYGHSNERAKIPRCGAVRAGLPAYHRARHHPGGQCFQRHKDGKRSHPRSRRKENPLRHKQLKYVCNIVRSSRLSA